MSSEKNPNGGIAPDVSINASSPAVDDRTARNVGGAVSQPEKKNTFSSTSPLPTNRAARTLLPASSSMTPQGRKNPAILLSLRPNLTPTGTSAAAASSSSAPANHLIPRSVPLVHPTQQNAVGLPSNFLLKLITGGQATPVASWGGASGAMTPGQRRAQSSASCGVADSSVSRLRPPPRSHPLDFSEGRGDEEVVSPLHGNRQSSSPPPPIPAFSRPPRHGGPIASTPSQNGGTLQSLTMHSETDAYATSNDASRNGVSTHPAKVNAGETFRQVSAWPATNARTASTSAAQSALMGCIDAQPGALTKALLDEKYGAGTASSRIANAIQTAKTVQVSVETLTTTAAPLSVQLLSQGNVEAEDDRDEDAKWDTIVGLEDAVLDHPVPQSASPSRAISPQQMGYLVGGGCSSAGTSPSSRGKGRAGALGRQEGGQAALVPASVGVGAQSKHLRRLSSPAMSVNSMNTPLALLHTATCTAATTSTRGLRPHALDQLEQLLVDTAARLRFEFPEEDALYEAAVAKHGTTATTPSDVLHTPVPRRVLPLRRFDSKGKLLTGAAAAPRRRSKQSSAGAEQHATPSREEVSWDSQNANADTDDDEKKEAEGEESAGEQGSSFKRVQIDLPSRATPSTRLKSRESPSRRQPPRTLLSGQRAQSPDIDNGRSKSTGSAPNHDGQGGSSSSALVLTSPQKAETRNPLTDDMWEYLDRRLQSHRHAAELFFSIFESYRPVLAKILDEYESYLAFIVSHSSAERDYLKSEADRCHRENQTLLETLKDEQLARRRAEIEADGLRAQVSILRHAETELKEQKIIFEHEQNMNQLQAQQNEADKTALTRKMMALEEEVESMRQQLAEPGKAIERLNAQIAAKNSHVHALSSQNDKLTSENASLKRQVTAARTRENAPFFANNERKAENGVEMVENSKLVSALNKLHDSNTTIAQLKGSIANNDEKIAIMRSQLDRLLLASGGMRTTSLDEHARDLSDIDDAADSVSDAYAESVLVPIPGEGEAQSEVRSRRSSNAASAVGRKEKTVREGNVAGGGGGGASRSSHAMKRFASSHSKARGASAATAAISTQPTPRSARGKRQSARNSIVSTTPPPPLTPVANDHAAEPSSPTDAAKELGESQPLNAKRADSLQQLVSGNTFEVGTHDLDELSAMYTPRPHVVSADLVQAQTTAERMTLAITTIAQLKTELNASRARVNELLTMKSMSLQALVSRMSDVFSSTVSAYHHPCFQDTVLAFNNPATRWFIGVGDRDGDTRYPYLRAVGRQRNQRFSLGAVKWHIHTFFAQSPPSWRGESSSGESFGDRLQRWLDSRYPSESPSMCYSFHTSLCWFATTDVDCHLVKAMLDKELDETAWRRAALITSRLRTEMERLEAQHLVATDPAARISTASAVDELLAEKEPQRKDSFAALSTVALGLSSSPSMMTSTPSTTNTNYSNLTRRRVSATFINDRGLPERCLVATPKNVSADVAVKAITNVFSLWSSDSISELVRALESTGHEAAAAAAAATTSGGVSNATREKFAHRKSIVSVPAAATTAQAQAPMNFRNGSNSGVMLSLAYLFGPVMISGGQMESYFTSAVRTLFVLEGHTFISDVIECLLEKSASAAGRVTPQMVVSAVIEADEECPEHIVHETCEEVFKHAHPQGFPLTEENKDAPIHDRYLKFSDVSIPLTACIARLRIVSPIRHTHRTVFLHHLNSKVNVQSGTNQRSSNITLGV